MEESTETLVASQEKRTAAERIEFDLARGILRSERPPGSRLPSVRALAVTYGVTVPTIQRALDRLSSTGLVTVVHGSGVTVNDPRQNMNPALIPMWFEALSDQPKRSAKILKDFLSLRRVLAQHLLESAPAKLLATLPRMVSDTASATPSDDLREIAIMDAKLTRVVVEAADNFAVSAFFSTIEKLTLEVPHIAEALYEDRAAYQKVVTQVMASFGSPDTDPDGKKLQRAFEEWDSRTVKNYAKRLKNSNAKK